MNKRRCTGPSWITCCPIDLGGQTQTRLPIRNAIHYGGAIRVGVPWAPRRLASLGKKGVPKSRYTVPGSLSLILKIKIPNLVDVDRLTAG